jgi:IS5 family transposase
LSSSVASGSADHFLRKLDEVVDWPRITKKLIRLYKGQGQEGTVPWDPALLLKMLLMAYLYGISERQVEEVANLNLAVKCFLGLGADQLAPDHSTLARFKGRLLDVGKLQAFEGLLGGDSPDGPRERHSTGLDPGVGQCPQRSQCEPG